MALVEFDALYPEVLATAPTCPAITIQRAMLNAARELCELSKCYRYRLEPEVVVPNDPEVALSLPSFTTLVAPITLSLNGEILRPTTPSLLEEDDQNWEQETGTPRMFMRSTLELNTVRLYPTPDRSYTSSAGLRGEVALKPSRAAPGVEEMVLDKYQTALVSGALSKLLMIASAPWYNPIQASYHAEMFSVEIEKAKARGAAEDLPKRRAVRYGGI
jgi:hypothetical protein